jgi:hypothetical protein
VDVLPLERFNAVWRPNEPERLAPVYVERVTIREALKGDLLHSLFGIVQLIEPTFGVRSCFFHGAFEPKSAGIPLTSFIACLSTCLLPDREPCREGHDSRVVGIRGEHPVLISQEMLVLYRRKSSPSWLKRIKEKVLGGDEGARLMRREPIMLRILRDIPVPSWKLVLPDKLLQFRPLDGLRADLVTVAGAHTCWHATGV